MSECIELAVLESLLDGTLAEQEASAIRAHAETCATCRGRLEELRAGRAAAGPVPKDALPDRGDRQGETRSLAPAGGFGLDAGAGPAGDSIPGYSIIREIHRGGQGVVYQAVQQHTRRKVAIKVMREGPFADRREKARFEREVEILGQLNHPNIVGVHDSGLAHGSFYFVMDYISGQPLDVWMSSRERSIEETLRLFTKICEAVNAAHLRGVIHRDLKPGNIRIDAEGEPHVLDFGLAKTAGAGEVSVMTVTGQFMGSLPWASPEQAEAIPGKVDVRTDVYSLGVILYQMLTGKFPYDVVGNMRDVLDRIIKIEPARPSTIRKQINDEVETIVLKCLSKERERRYQSAGELARDIGHYLAGEPIEAKRDSALYVLKKNLRRYKLPVAVAAGLALLLTAGLAVSSALYVRAEKARREAQTERDRADGQTRVAQKAKQKLEESIEYYYAFAINRAHEASQAGSSYAQDLLIQVSPYILPKDLRSFEWYYLWKINQAGPTVAYETGSQLRALALSPDGKTLATAGTDDTVTLIDLAGGRRRALAPKHSGWIEALDFSPDGALLASASRDKTARIWDVSTGTRLHELTGHRDFLRGVAFSPDGLKLLTGSYDGTARVWDVVVGRATAELTQESVTSVAWSPRGDVFVTGTALGRVHVWDAQSHQLKAVLDAHYDPANLKLSGEQRWRSGVFGLAFSPDGRLLASASWDGTAKIIDIASGRENLILRGHDSGLQAVAFSPDGRRVASGSLDDSVRLWDLASGRNAGSHGTHKGDVNDVLFSRDGSQVLSAGIDGKVVVWDTPQVGGCVQLSGHPGEIGALAFAPDGLLLACGDDQGMIKLWEPGAGRERATLVGHKAAVTDVIFSPDGRVLASAGDDATVKLWNVAACHEEAELRGHGNRVQAIAFSPDGRRLAAGCSDGSVRIWDLLTRSERATLAGHEGSAYAVAFSPDARLIASGGSDNRVIVWDGETFEKRSTWMRPWAPRSSAVRCLSFSNDGTMLAAGSFDRVVTLWEVATGQVAWQLRGHSGPVYSLAFLPDGRSLVTGSRDGTARLWSTATGLERLTLKQDSGSIYAVAVSPDGRILASGGKDKTIRLWKATAESEVMDGRERASLLYRVADVQRAQGNLELAASLARQAMESREDREDTSLRVKLRLLLASILVERSQSSDYAEIESLVLSSADLLTQDSALPGQSELKDNLLRTVQMIWGPDGVNDPERLLTLTLKLAPKMALNNQSWAVVKNPGASLEEYRRALKMAQAAAERTREGTTLNTLGAALLRTGACREALAVLTESELLNRGRTPSDAALAALAHECLGETEQARAAFERARRTLDTMEPELVAADERSLVQEAAAVLGGEARVPTSSSPSPVAPATRSSAAQPAPASSPSADNPGSGLQLPVLYPGDSPGALMEAQLLLCRHGSEQALALIQTLVDSGDDSAESLNTLAWALLQVGRIEAAHSVFRAVVAHLGDWSPEPPSNAFIQHWTAAYFLDMVTDEQFVARYTNHASLGNQYACWPWFYIGQRLEIEGKLEQAIAAYRKSVELGKLLGAHYIHNWSAYRLGVLTGTIPDPAAASARAGPDD